MKKIYIITCLMLLLSTRAFAACDYMNRCPEAPSFSKMLQTPPFIESFAQNIVKTQLKNATGLDFDVLLKSFTIADLFNGKFSSLTLSGKNIIIQGFHFSSLTIRTLCPFNSIDINSRPIKTRENMVVGVWAEVSAADLINTISYGDYLSKANSANLSKLGIASYNIYPSTINVENGKLYFTIYATPIGPYKPLDISVEADLHAKDGNIVASKINLVNLYTGFDLTQFSDFLSAINNLRFPIDLGTREKSEVQIKNIHIVGSRIFIDAMIFVPKM